MALTNNEKAKQWRLWHPKEARKQTLAAGRKWRKKPSNAKKNYEHLKSWRIQNPVKVRSIKLKAKYGIDAKQFDVIFEAQGKCCKNCKSTKSKGWHNSWHVDHDHNLKSKHVRGILCQRCNLVLGQLETNNLLQPMVEYLENASKSIQENSDLCFQEKNYAAK